MDFQKVKQIYFIGIGGIGMSALARYFNQEGKEVLGYDKTPSPLTDTLQAEGMKVHFEDLGEAVSQLNLDTTQTIVVYTPAIPKSHQELTYFINNGYKVLKRSEVLGLITQYALGLGIAGTHGKTTTSTMLAYILSQSEQKCNAFLGGISSNFGTNYLLDKHAQYTVIEADEFDRSFLKLHPFASIITACDPDHLDIYGTEENFIDGFNQYANLTASNGFVVVKKGLPLTINGTFYTYSISDPNADFYGTNLLYEGGTFCIDIIHKTNTYAKVELGLPGTHNAENAIACFAMCLNLGLNEQEIRNGLKQFKGVKRRFEYKIKQDHLVYIDDYAHHPTEINALIDSIKLLYPNRKITGIFQPHLFSRTNDFMAGFAQSLSRLDELLLMPIYPAREEPMEGVTSEVLLAQCSLNHKRIIRADEIVSYLQHSEKDIVLTIGAGDIDRIVEPLTQALQ